jgi:hypothetical protein
MKKALLYAEMISIIILRDTVVLVKDYFNDKWKGEITASISL